MAPEDNINDSLVLATPNAGENLVFQVPQGGIVDLGNVMEEVVSLTRDGDNFTLTFEDGGTLTLEGFFPGEEEASAEPILVIEGQQVPYSLFMANYGDNIEAAAGPTAGGQTGTGSGGAYGDGAGDLVTGNDALGKLGIINWGGDVEYSVSAEGTTTAAAATTDDTIIGGGNIPGGGGDTGGGDGGDTFNAPQLGLVNVPFVSESNDPDPDNVQAHTTTTHSITLTNKDDSSIKEPAGEDIRVTITLSGAEAGGTLGENADSEGADFVWGNAEGTGNVYAISEDGERTLLTTPEDYIYDPVTGECELTIPAGTVEIQFDVTTIDDLRETGDKGEANEGYTIDLELDKTDGLADDDASIRPGEDSTTTIITPDVRPEGELNPDNFDGPWVNISAAEKSVLESEGEASFKIKLTDPSQAAGVGPAYAADEPITVTMDIKGGDGFTMSDLFKPNTDGTIGEQTFEVTFYDADGKPLLDADDNPVTGTATIGGCDAQDTSGNLTVTLPPGAASVQIDIPINDDPLGADGEESSGSNYDLAEEGLTLTITDVEGNEARVEDDETSASTTIVDDDNSSDQAYDGMTIGLTWETLHTGGDLGGKYTDNENNHINLEEGNGIGWNTAYVMGLKLTNADGAIITGDATNPYAGYTDNNALPETTSITMTFGNTDTNGEAQDLVYTPHGHLESLIDRGHVTITYPVPDGETYTNRTDLQNFLESQDPQGFDGEVQINLIGGEFGTDDGDWQDIKFDAHASGDNVSEDHTSSNEQISVTVDSVDGNNETKIDDNNNKIEGTIVDQADGKITLDGGEFNPPNNAELNDFGSWSYTLNVSYKDNEKETDPFEFNINNHDLPSLDEQANITLPGEPVHLQLKITDSDNMENSKEYTVDAYTLFLSMNDLNGGETFKVDGIDFTVDDLDSYNTYLDALGDDLRLASGEAGNDGLILVHNEAPSPTYDVYVPENKFDENGNIEFEIDRGEHGGASGGFTVEAVNPGNPMGEITDVNGSVTAGNPDDEIRLSLDGGGTIQEDDAYTTTDTYTVQFENSLKLDAEGNPITGSPVIAAGAISFDLTFSPKGNTNFDFNLKDNEYLDTWKDGTDGTGEDGQGTGDVGLYIEDPKTDEQVIYGDKQEMLEALQAEFDHNYGTGNVTINDITVDPATGKITFEITAKEGFDLSGGIEIKFTSLDDSINDNNEKFNVQISNVDTGGKLNAVIDGDRDGTTTIEDETNGQVPLRNGFALSVEESSGNEANLESTGDDGKYIYVTTRAHILDNDTEKVMDLDTLYANFQKHTGDTSGLPFLPTAAIGNDAFEKFMDEFYAPTQDIIVDYTLSGGDAENNVDYVDNTQTTIPHEDWDLVIDEQGNIYYEANGDEGKGIQVETIKDHQSEGEEGFNLVITGANGNESRPGNSDDFVDWKGDDKPKDDTTVTILDVHDGPSIVNIGPAGGLVMEPVDLDHTDNDNSAQREVTYQIQLDKAAYEDMAVWFNPSGGAIYSEDYIFGEGVYWSDGGVIYKLDENGKPETTPVDPNPLSGTALEEFEANNGPDGYFVVIKEGETAAEFPIKILDDNDTANNDRGDDRTENIILDVTHVLGSEATVVGPGGLVPWDDTISFKYEFEGNVGVVDPVNDTFTYNDGINDVTIKFNDPDAPAWLPAEHPTAESVNKVQSDDVIRDDMKGPTVSLTNDTVSMEDVCQEDVTVTIKILDPDDIYAEPPTTIEVTIKKGETKPDEDSLANALKEAEIEGDYYMQIISTDGGETQHDSDLVYVKDTGGDGGGDSGGDGGGDGGSDGGGGSDGDEESTLIISTLTSTVIEESTKDAPDYPEYSFEIGNITTADPADVTFDISFLPGSAGKEDMQENDTFSADGKISVTIPKNVFEDLNGANHDEVTFTIKVDENGDPQLYYQVGTNDLVKVNGATVEGELPAATTDNTIEGSENFNVIITNTENVENNSAPATTEIKDMTLATVLLFGPDGNLLADSSFPEGSSLEVTAKLVLVNSEGKPIDAAGNPIDMTGDNWQDSLVLVTPTKPMEFEINYGKTPATDDTDATENSDYSGDQAFYFDETGEAKFEVIIHEDMITEGDESFTIGVTSKEPVPLVDGKPQIVVDEASNQIIITEAILNGPIIKTHMNDSVMEDGTLIVKFDSWAHENSDIRQVVEEEVTLTFELSPVGDSLKIKDDIESITYAGYTATIAPNGTVSYTGTDNGFTLTGPNESGVYTIKLEMPAGSAMGEFEIKTRDDAIDEVSEKFKVELVGTDGSETSIFEGNQEGEVTIKEDDNGYEASIKPLDGTEQGHAGIAVSFDTDGNRAPDEDVKFEFTIDPDQAELNTDGTIMITLPDGTEVKYEIATGNITSSPATTGLKIDYDDGKLSMTVPKDNMAPVTSDLEVQFPIHDNSLKDDYNFNVGVTIDGGEIKLEKEPSFDSDFVSETAAIGDHGGKTTFELTHDENSGSLTSVAGEMDITLENVDHSVIKQITVNGKPVTFSTGTGDDEGKVILTMDGVPISGDYEIEVTYKKPADQEAADRIADAKENLSVSGEILVTGNSVSVNVGNEANTTDHDSIVLSYALTDGVNANNEIVEGSIVKGTITVDMPNLPGDPGDVEGSIIIYFQVPLGADGKPYDIEWPDLPGMTFGPPNANGQCTITIKPGTEIPDDGKFDIDFTIDVKDNALVDNPSFDIGFPGSGGIAPEYEGIEIASGSERNDEVLTIIDEVYNIDNPLDGPTFVITAADNVTEGNAVTFNISSDSDTWKDVDPNLSLILEYTITGLKEGDTISFRDGSEFVVKESDINEGTLVINFPANFNNEKGHQDITITPADQAGTDGIRDISVTVSNAYEDVDKNDSIKELFENIESNEATVAVLSNDTFELSMKVAEFDSQNQTMMFTIAFAAVNAPPSLLPEELTFTVNLEGLDDAQKTAIVTELESQGVDANINDAGKLVVTLPSGYEMDPLPTLTFDVPVTNNAIYDIELEGVEPTDQLPVPEIDFEENGFAFKATVGTGTLDDPSAETPVETLAGDEGNDALFASNVDSLLIGGEGDDLLIGGTGDDTLIGGTGNDILIGGAGNDIMTGGEGSNTFQWSENDIDGSTDSILDFKLNNGDANDGDKIDLRDVLDWSNITEENQDNYLKVSNDGDHNVKIEFDKNGTGTFNDINQTINVTIPGSELSEQSLIDAVKAQILLDTGN